jgi:hypothetical protein
VTTQTVALYQDRVRVDCLPIEVAPHADATRCRAAVFRILTEAGYHVVSVSAPAALPAGHPPCDWVAVIHGAPIFRRAGKPVTRGGQPLGTPPAGRTLVAKQRALTGTNGR